MSARIVFTTFPDAATARAVGRTCVEERLAACVHLHPAGESIYHWQGEIEQATEVQAVFKTTHYSALEARIKSLHPYEVPEIIAVEIAAGLPAYLQWIDAEVK